MNKTNSKKVVNEPTIDHIINIQSSLQHNDALTENSSNTENKKELRADILENIIYPEIIHRTQSLVNEQRTWNKFARLFITLKYLSAVISIIFVFLSSSSLFSDNKRMTFALIGGLSHVISLGVCEQLGSYCTSNSERCLKKRNTLLKSIGIRYNEPSTNFTDINHPEQNQSTTMMQRKT